MFDYDNNMMGIRSFGIGVCLSQIFCFICQCHNDKHKLHDDEHQDNHYNKDSHKLDVCGAVFRESHCHCHRQLYSPLSCRLLPPTSRGQPNKAFGCFSALLFIAVPFAFPSSLVYPVPLFFRPCFFSRVGFFFVFPFSPSFSTLAFASLSYCLPSLLFSFSFLV